MGDTLIMMTAQTKNKKAAALIALNMRQPARGEVCPVLMARKAKMNSMLAYATEAFWELDKDSAFQVWFAAASDDCRAFAQDMNELIADCFA